jgi:hypothetical protein
MLLMQYGPRAISLCQVWIVAGHTIGTVGYLVSTDIEPNILDLSF